MQNLPLLLAVIGVLAILAGVVRLVVVRRKRARRRAYFRDRDARVRQQWADLESMNGKRPR